MVAASPGLDYTKIKEVERRQRDTGMNAVCTM